MRSIIDIDDCIYTEVFGVNYKVYHDVLDSDSCVSNLSLIVVHKDLSVPPNGQYIGFLRQRLNGGHLIFTARFR